MGRIGGGLYPGQSSGLVDVCCRLLGVYDACHVLVVVSRMNMLLVAPPAVKPADKDN